MLVITFITGNLKDCLIKELIPLKHLTYGITPKLNYYGTKTRVEFNGSCSKQDKITHTHGKILSIYIVYELTGSNSDDNDPTLKNSLFGAVTLTKKRRY